nr:unnamed protein product [Callosobruchus analis]
MNLFSPADNTKVCGNVCYVIDGGYLLHKFVWRKGERFSVIYQRYVDYVSGHFKRNVIIVFDGYSNDIAKNNTKSAERLRRAKELNSPDTLLDASMCVSTTQEQFLSNEKNKAHFIDFIKVTFSSSGISVKQADGDADLLIVQTALDISTNQESVVIVKEDTDLLVILSGIADSSHGNVFFMKPGRGQAQPQVFSTTEESEARRAYPCLSCYDCDPPTEAAARQHSLRVYQQVQRWKDIMKQPESWGWQQGTMGLHPIPTMLEAEPAELLRIISCKCEKGCGTRCSCRKAGLTCTEICSSCRGMDCTNRREIDLHDDDNGQDDPFNISQGNATLPTTTREIHLDADDDCRDEQNLDISQDYPYQSTTTRDVDQDPCQDEQNLHDNCNVAGPSTDYT